MTRHMTGSSELTVAGDGVELVGRRWAAGEPTYVAMLCHGYGEHVGRYEWVAEQLAADGAAVYGVDHRGHGRSGGERVLIEDYETVVTELDRAIDVARVEHPSLPVVLIGHSMGGLIASRYTQRYGEELACVVLSGPVLGSWDEATGLLALDEIPDVPIDPSTLSRNPAVGEAYVADELVWHGPFKAPTLHALVLALDAVANGDRFTVPALYLHGEADRLVPIGPSLAGWDAVKGEVAEQITYPGARHEIFNETNQDEVLADVIAFVGRHR